MDRAFRSATLAQQAFTVRVQYLVGGRLQDRVIPHHPRGRLSMISATRTRSAPLFPASLFAAAALAATLAACSSPAPPAPAPPPPPPVAVIPQVNLSPRVIEQASAYRAYVDHAGAISPGFTGAEDVAQGLKIGEAYEPQQLLRGAIAYGAVAALQDPAFVAGVRKYAADPDQRRTIAYEVMKDPAYAV